MNPYGSLSDDFYLYTYLGTELDLPTQRDTVLHFFGQVSKQFPTMSHFATREANEFVLEEDKEAGSYRWVTMEPRRLGSGYFNPPDLDDCHKQHELVLDMAPHTLSVNHLDCETLDVMFGFDLNYRGNHDEVVGQAFGGEGRFESLINMQGAKLVDFEPTFTLALDEECRRQARLGIITRTTSFNVRTGQYGEDPITVYLTVRQYWGGASTSDQTFVSSYRSQVEQAMEILDRHVLPNVVTPLAEAIATR